jgi:hypothetical protein
VAHACNPSYVGVWDQKDHGSRSTPANSLWDPISKITRAKRTRGVAQAVEHLLCKSEPPPKKKKKKERKKQDQMHSLLNSTRLLKS